MSKLILLSRNPSVVATPDPGRVAIFADSTNNNHPTVKLDNGSLIDLTGVFAPVDQGGKSYVDNINGDDGTAQRNNPHTPYESLGAAMTDALPGDVITVRPGNGGYDGTGANLFKDGVTVVFEGVGSVSQATFNDLGVATNCRVIAPGWTFTNSGNVVTVFGDSEIFMHFGEINGGNVGIFADPVGLNNRLTFIGKRCYGTVYGLNMRSGASGFAMIDEIDSGAIPIFFRPGTTQYNGQFHVICPKVMRPTPLYGTQHIIAIQTSDVNAAVKLDVSFKDPVGETDASPVFMLSAGNTEINMNIDTINRTVVDVNAFQSTNQGNHKLKGFIKSQDKEAILVDRNGKNVLLDDLDIWVTNYQQAIRVKDATGNLYIKKARIRNDFTGGYGIRINADPNVVVEDAIIQADAESLSAAFARNVKIYRMVSNVPMSGFVTNTITGSSIIEDAGVELEMQTQIFDR